MIEKPFNEIVLELDSVKMCLKRVLELSKGLRTGETDEMTLLFLSFESSLVSFLNELELIIPSDLKYLKLYEESLL